MFGIKEDDAQNNPVAGSDTASGEKTDAPIMPKPVSNSSSADDSAVNPITGNETLGPPQISSGLPAIIPGGGTGPTIVKKKKLLTSLPKPVNTPVESTPAAAPATSSPPASATQPADRLWLPVDAANAINTDELLAIKKEALQNLMPLVDKLDQPPDEKFKTIMMLLQASDNPDLVKSAYDTASKISNEKEQAQALLDVVNEINYFTHPRPTTETPPSNWPKY